MKTLSPALLDCIEAIDATLKRIERTLEDTAREAELFNEQFAAMSERLETIRKR